MSNQINVPPTNSGAPSGGGLQPNVASCLSYLCGWLTGLIFFLIEKDNKTVRFHALNSIALDIVFIVAYIGIWILTLVVGALLGPLALLLGLLNIVLVISMLVIRVVNMIKAYQGSELNLPVITDYVRGIINK